MNENNLIPGAHKLTVEEQSKGGKASGISRGFKSALKRKYKENPELYGELIDMLTDEALIGKNLKAAEMLIDLMGESVQRETLVLKKKEIKIKEEAANNKPEDTALHITIDYGDENESDSTG